MLDERTTTRPASALRRRGAGKTGAGGSNAGSPRAERLARQRRRGAEASGATAPPPPPLSGGAGGAGSERGGSAGAAKANGAGVGAGTAAISGAGGGAVFVIRLRRRWQPVRPGLSGASGAIRSTNSGAASATALRTASTYAAGPSRRRRAARIAATAAWHTRAQVHRMVGRDTAVQVGLSLCAPTTRIILIYESCRVRTACQGPACRSPRECSLFFAHEDPRALAAARVGPAAGGLPLPGVSVTSFGSAMIAALRDRHLQRCCGMLLVLLTLPVTLLTLGLFLFVINALMFWAAANVLDGFAVAGFAATLISSAIYSVCGIVIDAALDCSRRAAQPPGRNVALLPRNRLQRAAYIRQTQLVPARLGRQPGVLPWPRRLPSITQVPARPRGAICACGGCRGRAQKRLQIAPEAHDAEGAARRRLGAFAGATATRCRRGTAPRAL